MCPSRPQVGGITDTEQNARWVGWLSAEVLQPPQASLVVAQQPAAPDTEASGSWST